MCTIHQKLLQNNAASFYTFSVPVRKGHTSSFTDSQEFGESGDMSFLTYSFEIWLSDNKITKKETKSIETIF